MEKNTEIDILCTSVENGLNRKLGHLLIRERFFKKEKTLVSFFLENGGSFSSVPMVNHEKAILIAIPPQFGSDDTVVDEDENERFIRSLKEKGMEVLIPEIIDMAAAHRKQLPNIFEEMMKNNPINREKNPRAYELVRKRVMEPECFPLAYALPGFYTKPMEMEWKNGRKLYLLATTIPKITEKDLLRQSYFELMAEFLSGSVDPFVVENRTIIHYFVHVIPEEWKAVILITHSPIH